MVTNAHALQPRPWLLHWFLSLRQLTAGALLLTALFFADIEEIERGDEM